MNILQLEQERTSLKEKLSESYSSQANLLFIYDFFEKVLSSQNKNFIESYLSEFFPDYIHCLKSLSVFGLKPRIYELLIAQAEKIEKLNLSKKNNINGITVIIERLKSALNEMDKVLNGHDIDSFSSSKPFFPLLDEEAIKLTKTIIGVLESATIKISKTKHFDNFIIVPSEKEIEEKIGEQVKLSWLNAIKIAQKYVRRIHPYHEVIISFDKKAGFCKGNSLGTVLTLAFIEEMLKNYNSPLSITIGNKIAFTGGVDENGKITNTSAEIIEQKSELIFYSDIKLFIVPKEEETVANEKLNELKKEFPRRNLRIIGIEDLDDLLNRRNIAEIKKQPLIVRSGKFVKKNWISAGIAVLLTIMLSFLFVLDFDDNPYSFTADTDKIYIKNKSGKVLWTKNRIVAKYLVDEPNYLRGIVKIVNINDDGKNEVILSGIKNESEADDEFYPMLCYSYDGKLIWNYSFKDTVSSNRERLLLGYYMFIIDTLTLNGNKDLISFAVNSPSFSSAIFRLDLKTGKRLPGTFWCSGHTVNGILKDLNNDGKKDILCVGLDNGYEEAVLFGIEVDTTNRVRLTTESYLIQDYQVGDLITYIRFPKTDYDEYKNFRMPAISPASFRDEVAQKLYQFSAMDVLDNYTSCVWYQIEYNLKDINIIIDNRFRVMRDTLVAHGKLPLPFTDTPEYVEIIKSKILYWKDDKWVRRERLD